MRLRTLLMFVVLAFLMVSAVPAQMGGGMGGGRMPGMGTRGVMPMGGMLSSDMMELPIAPDGTVFVVRKGTAGAYDVAAISPAGIVRWTYPLESRGMTFAAISGANLVLSSMQTSITGTTISFTSQLIAISIASGSKLWTLDLNGGVPMGITAYSDGFYVVALNAQPSLVRKLISVGNDGKQRWSMNLD